MRRLLIGTALITAALVAGLWQSPEAHAQSTPVQANVYHPAGNSSYSAVLTCGWHDVCDGIFTDATKKGLDWIYQSNASYTVWVRVKIYGGNFQLVVLGTAYNASSGCKRILYDMFRYTNPAQKIGTIVNQHSQATSTSYFNLYTSSSGYQNSGIVGTMVGAGQDNCTSSGPHTMQWYTNSSATNVTKNASSPCTTSSCIPYESGCVLCYRPYGIWQTYEWLFTFYS